MKHLSIEAMIARTKTAMKSEKDADKLAQLAANLSAYKKTKTHIEKHETEEGEDEDEDEASEASESEESKGDETDRKSDDPDDEGDDPDDDKSKDKDDDDDADDDDEDDEEDDEAEEASYEHDEEEAAKGAASQIVRASGLTAKSSRRALRRAAEALVLKTMRSGSASKVFRAAAKLTGKRNAAAIISSLHGHAQGAKELATRVAAIETERRNERKAAMITEARMAKRITKREAADLSKKRLSFVQSYLDMRPTALVHTNESQLAQPADTKLRGNAPTNTPTIKDRKPVSAEVKRELDRAAAAAKGLGLKGEAFMSDLIDELSKAGARVTVPEN